MTGWPTSPDWRRSSAPTSASTSTSRPGPIALRSGTSSSGWGCGGSLRRRAWSPPPSRYWRRCWSCRTSPGRAAGAPPSASLRTVACCPAPTGPRVVSPSPTSLTWAKRSGRPPSSSTPGGSPPPARAVRAAAAVPAGARWRAASTRPTRTAPSPAASGSRPIGGGPEARTFPRSPAPVRRSSRRSDPMEATSETRPVAAPGRPRSLYRETTNRCDSKCQTCIRPFRALEPPADLTLERVKGIVEQFPVLDRVVLHGIGEPLLNREIFEIIAYLKTRGPTVLFNSDAIGLTAQRAPRLVESGLDEYRVSMDAATRDTYRRLRGVDQFDRVVANVRRLVQLERERARSTPRVSLWFTASRANLDELPAFVRLAAGLGVAEVYVQRLAFNGLGLATAENALHGRLHRQEQGILDAAEGVARAPRPAPPPPG